MMAISSYRTEQYRQLAATVDFWLTSLVIHGDLPAAVLDKLVQNIATGQFLIEPKKPDITDAERIHNDLAITLTLSGVLAHRLCVDTPLTAEILMDDQSRFVWDGRMPAALFVSFHKHRGCVVQVWESEMHPLDADIVARAILAATYQPVLVSGSH